MWDPKIHKYAYFAEFGNFMNSVIGPKKAPNALVLSKFTLSVHIIYFFTENFFIKNIINKK